MYVAGIEVVAAGSYGKGRGGDRQQDRDLVMQDWISGSSPVEGVSCECLGEQLVERPPGLAAVAGRGNHEHVW